MCVSFDRLTKTWWGPENPPAFNPRASIGEVIFYSLKRDAKRVAQINADDDTNLTFGQILSKSIRIAENLTKIGMKKGNIITLISKNNSELSSILFGSLMAGLAVSTLDPTFGTTDFLHMFKITNPKLIFCEPENLLHVKQALTLSGLSSKIIIIGNDSRSELTLKQLQVPVVNEDTYVPCVINSPESKIALIVCSSGTTGLSKGVCLSHAQLIAYTLRVWPVKSDDVTLAFSSLYWITGMATLLLGTVSGATRIITTKPFSPEWLLDIIERFKVTQFFAPPGYLAQLLDCRQTKRANLSSITSCITGGSAVLEELRRSVSKLFPNADVYVAYGLSELGATATSNFPLIKPGSVGKPVFGAIFKIIDGNGNKLGPNEKGEICIKFEYSFLGYMGNEEQTRAIRDADNWIHTGDLGYFDDEHFLFIVGRSKEIIKYRNFQVT